MKESNRFFGNPEEGGLAKIHDSGNADRLFKDAKPVTVKKEKLEEVDCSHVIIAPKDVQGKPVEQTFADKVIDPTVSDESFAFKPPTDAKDMRNR